jgi:hypothetical protein
VSCTQARCNQACFTQARCTQGNNKGAQIGPHRIMMVSLGCCGWGFFSIMAALGLSFTDLSFTGLALTDPGRLLQHGGFVGCAVGCCRR